MFLQRFLLQSKRKTAMSVIREQGLMLLMSVIGILILLLALLILFHENTNATKGYRLRTLEQERTQLLLQEEVQNMQIAELQSLSYLQDDLQIQGMINVYKPQYVQTIEVPSSSSSLQETSSAAFSSLASPIVPHSSYEAVTSSAIHEGASSSLRGL